MNGQQKRLPVGAGIFLIFIGLIADAMKIALDAFFGLGLILDPLLITPVTALIFGIVLSHNGISMFSGKRWISGWVNLIFSFIPVLDFLPDWTVYAIYLTIVNH